MAQNSDKPLASPPPPYSPNHKNAVASHSHHSTNTTQCRQISECIIARNQPTCSSSGQTETSRLRNFLLFTLVKDYQCTTAPPTTISAADLEHLNTLATILHLRDAAGSYGRPDFEDCQLEEPYMQQCLIEPCRVLNLQIEAVWLAITRFVRDTNFHASQSGPEWAASLFKDRPEHLARKLYVDRTIMIARLATSAGLANEMLDNLQKTSDLYFDVIHGLEITTLPVEPWVMNNISFELSEDGQLEKEYNEDVAKYSYAIVSPALWIKRLRLSLARRKARSQRVEAS